MTLSIDTVLSYAQALVFAALGWAWRLDGRITAIDARVVADVAEIRAAFKDELHALELKLRSELVPAADFRALEERIEKRLDRHEERLDEIIRLLRSGGARAPVSPTT